MSHGLSRRRFTREFKLAAPFSVWKWGRQWPRWRGRLKSTRCSSPLGMSHGVYRRRFTPEVKLAALQRLEMRASVAEGERAFEVNPNVHHRWRPEFREVPDGR